MTFSFSEKSQKSISLNDGETYNKTEVVTGGRNNLSENDGHTMKYSK